jgi:hypothetical protein
MLMGAAVIGCLAATMTSGASAQEANTTGQSNARTGQQPATSAQPNGSMRRGQGANMNARLNARANSNGTSANGQLERHGRTRASTREGRGYAAQRGMRGERGPYARVSEERYGRGWRGERGLYARARVEGGYRVGVTDDQLKGAPKYSSNTEWDWTDRSRDKAIYDYYRTPLWYV